MRKKKLDYEEAQRLRDAGWPISRIAKLYHVSDYTVAFHTKDHNRQKWTGDTPQVLRDAGWTLEEIAKELHATVEEIEQATHDPKPRKHYEHEWNESSPVIIRSNELI